MDDLFDWKIALLYPANMQKLIFGKKLPIQNDMKSLSRYICQISPRKFS